MASRLLFRRLLRPLLGHASSPTITATPFPLSIPSWAAAVPPRRSYSRGGTVNLVLTEHGAPKFETHESDDPPSKRVKWKTKKRLKLQRKREKRRRKEANRRDPRCIRPKGPKKGKHKFPDAEARIKYKLDKAKIKEAILVEKLKRYEVPNAQGPMVKSETLTGEERFYMKKMAQKGSNYVPVGRRGIFGGVILNMHLHWKKHETVKVICKPCKPGQVHEYAKDIARLSGGTPIQIIGDDTIIFYRGKNYVQPEVMSPIDTLSKKKALEKSKYEQSLETVRRFIAISEKELELYYRHVALYGDPNSRNSDLVYGDEKKVDRKLESVKRSVSMEEESSPSLSEYTSTNLSETVDSDDDELTGTEVDFDDDELTGTEVDSDDDPAEDGVYFVGEEPSETEVDSEDERNTSPM